jgi:hypothetical protein
MTAREAEHTSSGHDVDDRGEIRYFGINDLAGWREFASIRWVWIMTLQYTAVISFGGASSATAAWMRRLWWRAKLPGRVARTRRPRWISAAR